MTADQAREATRDGKGEVQRATESLLKHWHNGIRKAASEGRGAVTELEIGALRMPIPLAAKQAVINRLAADGFTVTVAGHGVLTMRVSWLPE